MLAHRLTTTRGSPKTEKQLQGNDIKLELVVKHVPKGTQLDSYSQGLEGGIPSKTETHESPLSKEKQLKGNDIKFLSVEDVPKGTQLDSYSEEWAAFPSLESSSPSPQKRRSEIRSQSQPRKGSFAQPSLASRSKQKEFEDVSRKPEVANNISAPLPSPCFLLLGW